MYLFENSCVCLCVCVCVCCGFVNERGRESVCECTSLSVGTFIVCVRACVYECMLTPRVTSSQSTIAMAYMSHLPPFICVSSLFMHMHTRALVCIQHPKYSGIIFALFGYCVHMSDTVCTSKVTRRATKFARTYACMHAHTHVCTYTRTHACMHACMHPRTRRYIVLEMHDAASCPKEPHKYWTSCSGSLHAKSVLMRVCTNVWDPHLPIFQHYQIAVLRVGVYVTCANRLTLHQYLSLCALRVRHSLACRPGEPVYTI